MTKSSSLESENTQPCAESIYSDFPKILIFNEQKKNIFFGIYHLNNSNCSTSFPVIINDVNNTIKNVNNKTIHTINPEFLKINNYLKKKKFFIQNIFFIIIIFILLLVILCIVLLFKL
jgi:hypothetical protein